MTSAVAQLLPTLVSLAFLDWCCCLNVSNREEVTACEAFRDAPLQHGVCLTFGGAKPLLWVQEGTCSWKRDANWMA